MILNKIIVRMPNWLGDFIMALPALEAIRLKYPKSQIKVMCSESFYPLLKNNKNIDSAIFYKKPKSFFSKETNKIIDRLERGKFDLGILLTNSFSSAYLFWKGKVKIRVGYKAHFRSFLLNKKMKFPKHINTKHLVDVYKELLQPLGIKNDLLSPKICLTEEDINSAMVLLKNRGYIPGKKLIGINPFAAYGPAKCWPKDRYFQVAKKLLEDEDLYVVFVGDKSAANCISEITKDLPKKALDLSGKTDILQLAGVIKLCSLFLTNDSGPMHLAAALKAPLIAIFGSTSDIKTGPYNSGIVINKKVACYPCFKRVCDKDFSCMKKIEVKEVVDLVKEHIYA